MVVGHLNSYKDLIVCALEGTSFSASHKTCQCAIYGKHTINTPNEYLENPKLYSALVSLSQQSTTIIFVKNANDEHHHFPPGFSSAFPCKSLGALLDVLGLGRQHSSQNQCQYHFLSHFSYLLSGYKDIKKS